MPADMRTPGIMRPVNYRTRYVLQTLFFVVFVLFLYYFLYRLRALDDSRLASWQDVFSGGFSLRTALSLLIGLGVAFVISRFSFSGRRSALCLFSVSFVMAVCFWNEPELIVDASRYFTQAKHLELYGITYFLREWGAGINAWTDLPAVPFLYGIMFSIFGEHRILIELINTLMFSSAVVLTYLTGKELWNDQAGLYGGIFLLGIPYLYTQVPLMLVDVAAMSFFMLAVYTFIRALRKGGMMIAGAGLSIFLSFFTKYSAWLMLTLLVVIFIEELLANRRKEIDRFALRGMIVFFTSFFLISLVIAFNHDVMMKQIHLLLTFQRPGLRRWGESFLATYFFQVHPVITLLAAASVAVAFRKKDYTYAIIVWVVLLALVLQIRRIRYLIMIFPMLCLMASYGLIHITRILNPGFVALSTAACSFVLAYTAFLPFQQSTSAENIRDAAGYLNSLDISGVEVITPLPGTCVMNPSVSVPLLDLFLCVPVRYQYSETEYPIPGDLDTSPLRFTWTYRNPPYYAGDGKSEKIGIVVITDSTERDLGHLLHDETERFAKIRTFAVRDDVYQHQTLVTVYH